MKLPKWNTPYVILDNFLKPEHLAFFDSIDIGNWANKTALVWENNYFPHNQMFANRKVISNSNDGYHQNPKIANDWDGKFMDDDLTIDFYFSYYFKLCNWYRRLAPSHETNVELSLSTKYQISFPEHEHGMHNDLDRKDLSVTIYLDDDLDGTMLYTDNKTYDVVPAKRNRALIFARNRDGSSMHNYRNLTDKPRRTCVMNLERGTWEKVQDWKPKPRKCHPKL